MKRTISILLVIFAFVSAITINSSALPVSQANTIVTYLENGDYIVEELAVSESRGANMTTGSKIKRYYNSNHVEQWRAVLTGTFSYNGSKATCTVSACDVTITNTNWYVISKSAEKSSNVARCSVTMGLRASGITVDEESISIKLTCDPNGNVS